MQLQVDIALPGTEMDCHPDESRRLTADRGESRPRYSPAEDIDEQRTEDDIDRYGKQGRNHRLTRVARGAHEIVQPDKHERYRSGVENHAHELAGIRNCFLSGPEQQQYVIKEQQTEAAEHK